MMMADRSGSHIRAQQACKQGSTADHGWYVLVAAPDVHRLRIHTHTQSLSALLVAGGGLATLSAPSLHRETRVAGLECQD